MNQAKTVIIFATALTCATLHAQTKESLAKSEHKLNTFFASYKPAEGELPQQARMKKLVADDNRRTITIVMDNCFAQQSFTDNSVGKIYSKVKNALAKPYNKYKISITTVGLPIEQLVAGSIDEEAHDLWGDINYDGKPWVENISAPVKFSHGLYDRHITLWASHGRYYDSKKNTWKWQRPNLFTTNEDLFTQTIVVPYLIPMLQNAGAVVFTPRERDWQKEEVIVDNDDPILAPYFSIRNGNKTWRQAPSQGFKKTKAVYSDGDNPFCAGTCLMAESHKKGGSTISYTPKLEKEGPHAVYVSYQTVPGSVDDALYTVWHKGQATQFHVNQTMGGGTWVYLGTFDFDKGCNEFNRVEVSNASRQKGFVTTDAVRFGGGMGNIERGGYVSNMPRALEGARYYAQWAGAPYSIYSTKQGQDDYGDDINTRSLMSNWLAGGSCYVPTKQGLNVPIELSLAVHSDAGYQKDGRSIFGSLAVCTTFFNDGRLNSGISRQTSKSLADLLLTGVNRDMRSLYGTWNRRDLYDRNYSETRLPAVPSAILETLSHQSFPDMKLGLDPNFRFNFARSVYKTIVRYISDMHGCQSIISPLTPNQFSAEITDKNKVTLRWQPVADNQEPTAIATSYNIYTATGTGGFDNGTNVRRNEVTLDIEPGVVYSYRVTAVNRGGESFPTQVLSVCYRPEAKKTILIVDGFDRLSSPAVIDNVTQQGFSLTADPGVSYGLTAGTLGAQQDFDTSKRGVEGPGGMGYTGEELAGRFIAGNDFNYVRAHADAINASRQYNIVSCSHEAVENGQVLLGMYQGVDLLLGLQKYDGHATKFYKSFTSTLQSKLTNYVRNNGRLIVSGAYVASDMTSDTDSQFLANVLKLQGAGTVSEGLAYSETDTASNGRIVNGLGTSFALYSILNDTHYAATTTDALQSVGTAFCAMQYADGRAAAVAYDGTDYKSFTTGFPLECIKSASLFAQIMHGILNFVMK